MLPVILFPEAIDPSCVDPAFADEEKAARQSGFQTAVLDGVLRRVSPGPALYRGWMLTPTEYESLYEGLAVRGVMLLTNPAAYRVAHYLPEAYPLLEPQTPESLWFPASVIASSRPAISAALARTFGDSPLVIKDYVKSEKGYWDQACFIPSASDVEAVWRVVDRFLELRGPHLNVGVVFRRFLPLDTRVAEERIFWLDHRPLWPSFQAARFEGLARSIASRFFTMDVALVTEPGDCYWTVIECGDGQVSSFRAGQESEFYATLYAALVECVAMPDPAQTIKELKQSGALASRMFRALQTSVLDFCDKPELPEALKQELRAIVAKASTLP